MSRGKGYRRKLGEQVRPKIKTDSKTVKRAHVFVSKVRATHHSPLPVQE